jgi:hypothetical protein
MAVFLSLLQYIFVHFLDALKPSHPLGTGRPLGADGGVTSIASPR